MNMNSLLSVALQMTEGVFVDKTKKYFKFKTVNLFLFFNTFEFKYNEY
ncbi:hypothetical protein [Piscirickettsia salmonis]